MWNTAEPFHFLLSRMTELYVALQSKEAKWATKFDAETAVALLQKMLSSSGGLAQDAKSGDSPDSSLPGSILHKFARCFKNSEATRAH